MVSGSDPKKSSNLWYMCVWFDFFHHPTKWIITWLMKQGHWNIPKVSQALTGFLNLCQEMYVFLSVLFYVKSYRSQHIMNTCSTFIVLLQFSSAGPSLDGFWVLRGQSLRWDPRASPSFAIWAAIRVSLWVVFFLASEGGDTGAWTDSYSGVLDVTGRGAVGLERGLLLLCHCGSMRRRQSDEERGHHPFLWSCWCHDYITPQTA